MDYIGFTVLLILLHNAIICILYIKRVPIHESQFVRYAVVLAPIFVILTIVPLLFTLNSKKSELQSSYELVNLSDSEYISTTGGESVKTTVCYIDDKNIFHTYSLDGKQVLRDDGASRIDTYVYRWLFLKGEVKFVYINDGSCRL